jgi:hypothetical protein
MADDEQPDVAAGFDFLEPLLRIALGAASG